MLHLIGIEIKAGTSLRRRVVDSIAFAAIGFAAIVGIITLASCGQEELDEPMKLTAVCTDTPAKTVACTWIPLEEKHRTEAEQKLYEERR